MRPLLIRPSLAHRGQVLLLVVLCACLVTGAAAASTWLRTTADDLASQVFGSDFARAQVKVDYLDVPASTVPAGGTARMQAALPPAIADVVTPPRHSVSSPEMVPKPLPQKTGLPGFATVAALPNLADLVEIRAGRLPRPGHPVVSLPGDIAAGYRANNLPTGMYPRGKAEVVEVILEVSGAEALDVGVDSYVALGATSYNYQGVEPAVLHVVGLYRPAAPYPTPLDDLDTGRKALIDPTPNAASVRFTALAADEATVLGGTWEREPILRWTFDPNGTPSAGDAGALVEQARQLELQTWPPMARSTDYRAQTGLGDLAQKVVDQRSTSDGMAFLALTSLAAGGFAVLLAAALLLAGRRSEQTEVVRARGASHRWLTAQRGAEAVLIVLPGLALAAAVVLLWGDDGLLSVDFAVAVVTAVVCAALVTGAQAVPRATGETVLQVVLRDASQLVLVVLAIAVGLVVWRRGEVDSGDPLTLLAAPLVGSAAAVVVMRVLQLLLSGLRAAVQQARRLTPVVGLSEAVAISRRITVAAGAVVLALACVVLALATTDSLRSGAERTGWEQVGADLVVQSPGFQDDAVEEIASLPGTEAVAPVFAGDSVSLETAEGVEGIRLIAFDPTAMREVGAESPIPVDLPAGSGKELVALASPDLQLDGEHTELRYGSSVTPVRVVDRLAEIPGVTSGESFLAVDAAALTRVADRNLTDYAAVLVKGDPNLAAVERIVHGRNPLGVVEARSAVTEGQLESPVVTRSTALLTAAAVAGGVVAVFAVVFIVTLGAPVRRRTTALLAALGADDKEARRVAGLGIAPLVAGTCLAAIGCGTALVLLADHGLALGPLIGAESPLPVRPSPWSALGVVVGCLLLVVASVVAAGRRTRHQEPDDRTERR